MDCEYLRSHWQQVRADLVATIAKFGDDDLDFRPFPASWTVGQLLLHIAYEERVEFGYGIVQTLDQFPEPFAETGYTTIAAIQALLAAVHAETSLFLQNLNKADLSRNITAPWGKTYRLIEMLGHLIEHEIHHRGELSLILGMLGRPGLDA